VTKQSNNSHSQAKISHITHVIQKHMALYGYEQIHLPLIEPAQLFLTRAGSQLIDQLVEFKYYGRHLALRPEFTASAAAHYVQHGPGNIPARWQLEGSVFRDNPSDASTDYQRLSLGAELIGMAQSFADAEIINMAVEGVTKIGIDDVKVVCGHVGLQKHLLNQFGLDSRTTRLLLSFRHELDKVDRSVDHLVEKIQRLLGEQTTNEDYGSIAASNMTDAHQMLDVLLESTRYSKTMGGRTRAEIAQRVLEKKQRKLEREQLISSITFMKLWREIRGDVASSFDAISQLISPQDNVGQKMLDDWRTTLDLMHVYGMSSDKIIIQPDLARDWEYYTGMVFGLSVRDTFIAGGGRYDELIAHISESLGTPAVGFAYYIDRLLEHTPDDIMQGTPASIQIIVDEHTTEPAIRWAKALRQDGIQVVLAQVFQISQQAQSAIIQDNEIVYGGQPYSLDNIDDLISELKATST